MRKEISLDIDGVCAMTNERVAEMIAEKTGEDFRYEHITDWNLKRLLMEQWGISEDDASYFMGLYSSPDFFASLEPYRVAQIGMLLLRAMGYSVSMNSSRPGSCAEATYGWARNHFGRLPRRVNVWGWSEKVLAIVDSGAALHLDDHDETVKKINAYGGRTKARLIPCPWNRTGVVPASDEISWPEFLLLALKNRQK